MPGDDRHRQVRLGRAPKVYEPAAGSVSVSIPDSRPELLAEILVEAVAAPAEAGPACAQGGWAPNGR